MSWNDIMRRMLPPVKGVVPDITSPYGDTNRPEGSSNPHGGVDFDYLGGQNALNQSHQGVRSPVDGIVENAGAGTAGRIAIRDKNGVLHEILHTHSRHVSVGDPLVAGQLIGTMGNTGVKIRGVEKGDHHVHYQMKDRNGQPINPTAFFDQQGPVDPNPPPPALLQEYREYRRALGTNIGDARLMGPNTSAPFGTGGQFEPGSATSSRPLYESRSFAASPAETSGPDPQQNIRRLVRVPTSTLNRVTQAPPPNQLATGDSASFDDRFGRWTASPEASAPLGPYQGVPVSPDGRPLGIFTGQPMPDYPFPPPIWGFPDEEVRQGSEDWAGWNPKSAAWKGKPR